MINCFFVEYISNVLIAVVHIVDKLYELSKESDGVEVVSVYDVVHHVVSVTGNEIAALLYVVVVLPGLVDSHELVFEVIFGAFVHHISSARLQGGRFEVGGRRVLIVSCDVLFSVMQGLHSAFERELDLILRDATEVHASDHMSEVYVVAVLGQVAEVGSRSFAYPSVVHRIAVAVAIDAEVVPVEGCEAGGAEHVGASADAVDHGAATGARFAVLLDGLQGEHVVRVAHVLLVREFLYETLATILGLTYTTHTLGRYETFAFVLPTRS